MTHSATSRIEAGRHATPSSSSVANRGSANARPRGSLSGEGLLAQILVEADALRAHGADHEARDLHRAAREPAAEAARRAWAARERAAKAARRERAARRVESLAPRGRAEAVAGRGSRARASAPAIRRRIRTWRPAAIPRTRNRARRVRRIAPRLRDRFVGTADLHLLWRPEEVFHLRLPEAGNLDGDRRRMWGLEVPDHRRPLFAARLRVLRGSASRRQCPARSGLRHEREPASPPRRAAPTVAFAPPSPLGTSSCTAEPSTAGSPTTARPPRIRPRSPRGVRRERSRRSRRGRRPSRPTTVRCRQRTWRRTGPRCAGSARCGRRGSPG